ncbi:MAG: hypothetical protein ACLQGP_05535 [Isosphaeraceae bacterium]
MPTKLNIPLRGKPCGKARYYKRPEADGHCQALESWERSQGRPSLNLGPLNVYWCDRCDAWHVGHKTV